MKTTSIVLSTLIPFLHLTNASPADLVDRTATALTATPYTATFDENSITPNLLDNLLDIITTQPLGPYQGLDYNGLTLANAADLIIGPDAQSGTNVIFFDIVSSATHGPATIKTLDAPNPAAFGLKSLYFSCLVLTFVPLASPSESCILSISGEDSEGNEVASASAKFKAAFIKLKANTLELSTPMQKFTLPSNFSTHLSKVTFSVKPFTPILSAALIDTIEEVLYL